MKSLHKCYPKADKIESYLVLSMPNSAHSYITILPLFANYFNTMSAFLASKKQGFITPCLHSFFSVLHVFELLAKRSNSRIRIKVQIKICPRTTVELQICFAIIKVYLCIEKLKFKLLNFRHFIRLQNANTKLLVSFSHFFENLPFVNEI